MAAKRPEPEESDDSADVRRKFREALERKRQQTRAGGPRVTHDGSEKSHGTVGPTQSRMFRRKSG